MQLQVGSVLEGKVTGITKFGVFVELEKGVTGMVHISEVASSFVSEIRDYVKENDVVKVKVLQCGDDGKISLSMKRAAEPAPGERKPQEDRRGYAPRRAPREHSGFTPKRSSEPQSFEDMMAKFKQSSDEKFMDLKRKNGDVKRNTRRAPR